MAASPTRLAQLAQVHGWNPAQPWKSLQFVDAEDEASFRESDYSSMHWVHVVTSVLQAYIMANVPDDDRIRDMKMWTMTLTCIQGALVFRERLSHAQMGFFVYACVLSEWAMLIYSDLTGKYVILQSDVALLLTFFGIATCQALLVFHAVSYSLASTAFVLATGFTVPLIYLSVSQPDPSLPLIMEPPDFYKCFCLVCVFAAGYMQSQTFTRRLFTAQQLHVAEQLRCEKDRLRYDLALARRETRARTCRRCS